MYVLSEWWIIHLSGGYFMLSGGYSQPVPTSVGRTLVFAWSTICTLFKTQRRESESQLK